MNDLRIMVLAMVMKKTMMIIIVKGYPIAPASSYAIPCIDKKAVSGSHLLAQHKAKFMQKQERERERERESV